MSLWARGILGEPDAIARGTIEASDAEAGACARGTPYGYCGLRFSRKAGAHAVAQRPAQGFARQDLFRQGGANLPFYRLHRCGAVGRDGVGGRQRSRQERLAGDDPVDEPEPGGGGGVDQVGGQQEFHGVHVTDLLHEFDGRPAEGVDRPEHFRQPKAGARDCGPDVGREQQLEAPPTQSPLTAAMTGLEKGWCFKRA
jgi:hypothetical protein